MPKFITDREVAIPEERVVLSLEHGEGGRVNLVGRLESKKSLWYLASIGENGITLHGSVNSELGIALERGGRLKIVG